MKNILSVLYVFVMLVKQQEQNIEFTIVIPISRTQMDISEWYFFPSHSQNTSYKLLLKERWVGGNLTFFGPPSLRKKNIHLFFFGSEESSSEICFILFRFQETKLDEKGTPWSLLCRLSKYENTKRACTSSGSLNPRISVSSIISPSLQAC